MDVFCSSPLHVPLHLSSFQVRLANLSTVSFREITIGKYCLPAAFTAQGPLRQASAVSSSLVGCWLMRKLPQRSLAISFQRHLDWVPKDTCRVGTRARTSGFDVQTMKEGKLKSRGWGIGTQDETERTSESTKSASVLGACSWNKGNHDDNSLRCRWAWFLRLTWPI